MLVCGTMPEPKTEEIVIHFVLKDEDSDTSYNVLYKVI